MAAQNIFFLKLEYFQCPKVINKVTNGSDPEFAI